MTTAISVPRCSETSNVWLNASCSFRYCQSPSQGTRIRWPEEEIGSSSVAPWTRPSTSACQFGSAPAWSPTPRSVSTIARERQAPAEIQRVRAAHRRILRTVARPGRGNQNFSQFAEKTLRAPLPGSDRPVRFLHAESTERD